jgi:signal transduction histidine kinase
MSARNGLVRRCNNRHAHSLNQNIMLDNLNPTIQQFTSEFDDPSSHCLSHDLAEILMIIQGCCELMPEVGQTQQTRLIATMLSACRRGASMLTPGRIRSNSQDVDPASSHLAQIVYEVSQMVGAANPDIHISVPIISDDLWINMPSPVLFRCLMNVVTNAAEAVCRDNNRSELREIEVSVASIGKVARISITNFGPVIAAEVMDKIFTPYFSAQVNSNAKNRGLGLFIVRTLLQQFGGTVNVHSSLDYGTTFQIDVPIKFQFQL